jgi:UTP-glucose-1-phosphate uridylyltransferase
MHKPTLVILAAGMASRFGSQKQTEGFGPSGETIMDYSIYDAIKAGFGKIVFIIREDFAQNFEPIFNAKLANKGVEVAYVYQALQSYTNGYTINPERTKPWGTAHALLCASSQVNGPFAVINADDFYGTDAFTKASNFLQHSCTHNNQSIIGYALKNTLSDNGTVSRGVCALDDNGNLKSVTERTKVYESNGQLLCDEEDGTIVIPDDAKASMNFFCFHQNVMDICKKEFDLFLQQFGTELKSEFYLTNIADYLIKNQVATIQVIPTDAKWFGVTYKEDAPIVKEKVEQLVASNAYSNNLWG